VPPGEAAGSRTTKATLGLRELIFNGELAPGQCVPEVAVAVRLGVSRTPLRLALGTLAHEGLLKPLTGGGFLVCSFTLDDVADAIELRGVLEGTAARFAAERLESPLALRARHGARADEIAREHARRAKLDLELMLESKAALERLPGAPLLRVV
jgi:GntR family transcriptional regulator, vanillate catabolism transcriptional regulator